VLSLALTVACAKFTHQHPSALNSIFHSTVCSTEVEAWSVRSVQRFGDSVALTFESEARGRSLYPPRALPKSRLRPCA
jgi:hypothetical protein